MDLTLLFFHTDIAIWIVSLHHAEGGTLLLAFFLLARVGDQIGFGFRRSSTSITWWESRISPMCSRYGAHILVAEDNPINQMVVQASLTKLGCKVDLVATGTEAYRAAVAGAYDLIFMDCHMPELDGYEATRRIRASEQALGRRTPILALTAGALNEDRERCLAAGMDEHLSKPLTRVALTAALDQWLSPAGSATPA